MSLAATQLLPPPTTKPPAWPLRLPPQSRLQDSLHEPHARNRDEIIVTLSDHGNDTLYKHARRMANCGSSAQIEVDPATQEARPWIWRCRSPLCPFCAVARAAKVRDQLALALKDVKRPRTLVLTVKSTATPLDAQLADMQNAFSRLRRTAIWKHHVKGGVYTIEITRNKDTGLFHPHIHAIYDGDFFPHADLRKAWHKITGNSEIVWLEDVRSRSNAIAELAKYISKPARIATWPKIAIVEYARGTMGKRFTSSFGNCRHPALKNPDPHVALRPDSIRLSITAIAAWAAEGDATAQTLIPMIAALWPLFGRYLYSEMPSLEPEESLAARQLRTHALITGESPPEPPPAPSDEERHNLNRRVANLVHRLHAERYPESVPCQSS